MSFGGQPGPGGLSSNSFESAVARAKMLAAKLAQQAPGGGPPGGSSGGGGGGGPQKRPYEDDDDDYGSKRHSNNDPFGAQLAAMKNQAGGGGGGPAVGNAGRVSDTPYLHGIVINGEKTLDIMVPGTKVGYIIGKGGEMIRNLQERAGVKMTVFQQTSEASEGPKQLRIVGAPDKVNYAKELIDDLLTEKELETMKIKTNRLGSGEYGSNRFSHVDVPVPPQYIGLVIGKGGESIKRIQADSGTKIQFDTQKSDERGNKVCQISGPSDCVKRAEDLIREILDNAGNHRNQRHKDGEEVRMPVPANRTGAVIGRGGETIRAIKQQCGCDIELDKNTKVAPGEDKIFIIRGPPERIPYAQQLINEKVNGANAEAEGNPYGAQSGDYSWPAGYWQQEQQQPQQQSNQASEANSDATAQWAAYYAQYYAQSGGAAGQPDQAAAANPQSGADYSAQWAEYYRAYGMHKEAEMIEQMAKGQSGDSSHQSSGNGSKEGEDTDKGKGAPVAYPGYNYGSYGGSSGGDK